MKNMKQLRSSRSKSLSLQEQQLSFVGSLSIETPGASLDAPASLHSISGFIQRVLFFDEDTGQCLLDVRHGRKQETLQISASLPKVWPGQGFRAQFSPSEWIKKTGCLTPQNLSLCEPPSSRALKKFLKSGAFPGLKPKTIQLLAESFPGELFSVLRNSPLRLKEIQGIGPSRTQEIIRAWEDYCSRAELEQFLYDTALPLSWAQALWASCGREALGFLQHQPYAAANRFELSFERIDKFALAHGFASESLERLRCGLNEILRNYCQQGHCACPEAELLCLANDRLGASSQLIEEALELELIDESLVAEVVGGTPCIYLKEMWDLERLVAQQLLAFEHKMPSQGWYNPEKIFSCAQGLLEIQLAPGQRAAVEAALSSPLTVITGGPGTGKTTLIRSLVTILESQFIRYALCSPTGRAAQRLSEASGVPARTIHRLLQYDGLTREFCHSRGRPLDLDLVLIDEASMIDLKLLSSLLEALPEHCSLILVGDADQLPSVGSGSILQSIIGSDRFPVVTLTDMFRQSEKSFIRINAERINSGIMPINAVSGKKDFHYIPVKNSEEARRVVDDLLLRVIPREYGNPDPRQLQILTPMNRGPMGCRVLNEELHALYSHGEHRVSELGHDFKLGDKVMVIKNDYKKNVFNGDVGFVIRVDQELKLLELDLGERSVVFGFDELDHLTLAYAISIHKAQGSEYNIVIVLITGEHLPLAQRHLVYTAITRGKEQVFLVAEPSALGVAIGTSEYRWQKLTELLTA